jgi:hypothetical protein
MTTNPILEELYAVRTEIMAEYGNDLRAYLRDAPGATSLKELWEFRASVVMVFPPWQFPARLPERTYTVVPPRLMC